MYLSKKCPKCLEVKDISDFTRSTGTLRHYCELCTRQHLMEWKSKNPDRVKKYKKKHYLKHAEEIKERVRRYNKNNTEKIKQKGKVYRLENKDILRERKRLDALKWRRENPHLAAAQLQKRRCARAQRIPQWLTAQNWIQIEQIYLAAHQKTQETGIKHHVDHVIPLRGENVSGLHVPWNLQVIPAVENLRKGNRF